MPRLYVAPPLSAGVLVALDGGQANYLGNVLRLKEGDAVAGIAVFHAGLAEDRGIGDNDEPDADPDAEPAPSPA